MVASAIFITDSKGKILISRNYRGDIPVTCVEKFTDRLHSDPTSNTLPPIFNDNNITYLYLKHNDLFFLAVTRFDSNAAAIFTFINKLIDIFKAYFSNVTEDTIRDNFVVIYELMDEVMDFGYVQTTDQKILKEYITLDINLFADVNIDNKGKLKLKNFEFGNGLKFLKQKQPKVPVALTNAVSWRSEGIKHRKNEIFLDVVEKLNLLVSKTGEVLHCDIIGCIKMKSFLSGMPELKLGLNDKEMFKATGRSYNKSKAVELEDIKFHQCVRLNRFENDRTISFVPPDGEFDLMTYRLSNDNLEKSGTISAGNVKPLIWVETVVESHKNSRIEYLVKAKSQFKSRSIANGVEIFIPVPPDVDSPSFKANTGTVTYVPDKDAVIWSIKQFAGSKEYLMRAHFGLPSTAADVGQGDAQEKWKKPIKVKFEIPYFTVSGIQVRYLKIVEKSGYQALPWVRYITQNGDYQLRMN